MYIRGVLLLMSHVGLWPFHYLMTTCICPSPELHVSCVVFSFLAKLTPSLLTMANNVAISSFEKSQCTRLHIVPLSPPCPMF